MRERENEENKFLVRESERLERREKKKQLERKWEMLRWVTDFLKENGERWRDEGNEREEEAKKKLADWERRSRLEKIEILKEKYKLKPGIPIIDRQTEGQRERARRRGENWKMWRNPAKEAEVTSNEEETLYLPPNNAEVTSQENPNVGNPSVPLLSKNKFTNNPTQNEVNTSVPLLSHDMKTQENPGLSGIMSKDVKTQEDFKLHGVMSNEENTSVPPLSRDMPAELSLATAHPTQTPTQHSPCTHPSKKITLNSPCTHPTPNILFDMSQPSTNIPNMSTQDSQPNMGRQDQVMTHQDRPLTAAKVAWK
jgi:hypothetical protein